MAGWLDVCRYNPTTGGTTDWTYSSAVVGYQSPTAAGVVDSIVYRYRAESSDLTQWEVGYGAYTVSSGVLARTTVLFNSSGTGTGAGQSGAGSKINFASPPQVAIVALAEDLSSLTALDAMMSNNLLINSNMEISQENAATQVTIASGGVKVYPADMWFAAYVHGALTAVFKAQGVLTGGPALGIAGYSELAATTLSAMAGAGDYAFMQQSVEGYRWSKLGYGAAGAQSCILGFYVYATIAGTATAAIRNSGAARSYLADFTINSALTWEYKTITIPADVAGTWLTTTGVGGQISFCFGGGTTFQGTNVTWQAGNFIKTAATTNFFATNGNVARLAAVTLTPGTDAIPTAARAPFLMRSYDAELPLCQRHFSCNFPNGTAVADNVIQSFETTANAYQTNGLVSARILFPVQMRATPTLTAYSSTRKASPTAGQWQYFNAAGVWTDCTSTVLGSASPEGTVAVLGATVTLNNAFLVCGNWKADARL